MREIEMVPCSIAGCLNMAPALKGAFSGMCSVCAEERRIRMGWAPITPPKICGCGAVITGNGLLFGDGHHCDTCALRAKARTGARAPQ